MLSAKPAGAHCHPHWEAEEGGLQTQAQPGQCSNLIRCCIKIKTEKGLGVSLIVKALNTVPSTTKRFF